MRAGVVVFPGSNCDHDLMSVLSTVFEEPIEALWHQEYDLKGCTHIFLPGGFSYGDYLRSGAIAKLSPIMQSVTTHAHSGGFVMGICNGFQILCEAGLLPGALLRNTHMQFICKNVYLTPSNNTLALTRSIGSNHALCVPIAHGEGRFYCSPSDLESIEKNGQVVFRYCNENGEVTDDSNPNGSLNNIAGICNAGFNVFGMMPHPERCSDNNLFNNDGLVIFQSILGAISA